MARLSRGSSAESSLRRTKRKAPPPPTSPSVFDQESVPLDENLQGLFQNTKCCLMCYVCHVYFGLKDRLNFAAQVYSFYFI